MNSDEKTSVYDKLLSYQKPHLNNIMNNLLENKRTLDTSDTGTGKTYCSVAASVILKKKLFIICPKSVIESWLNVLEYFGAEYYGIANYESLANCKYYYKNEKLVCPYLERIEYQKPIPNKIGQTKKVVQYFWNNLPNDIIFVWDEAHRCKNSTTLNYKMLKTLQQQKNINIILLSATLSDKIKNFRIAGYVLGLYRRPKDYGQWLRRIGGGMKEIHNFIFPHYAARMRIKDLGDIFKNNKVNSESYDMGEDAEKEIQEMYDVIEEETKRLKKLEDNSGSGLARMLYARMRIEQLKIPTFLKIAREKLQIGKSVAIFINFTNTLLTLKEELKTECVIYGEQTMEDRNSNIHNFTNDKERVIICNIRSGGVGISLHDTIGVYPRESIISPSFSAQDIIQVLGRLHRANGKTDVVQNIVYCKNTVEERICASMAEKINNIANLNDGTVSNQYLIDGMNNNKDSKKESALFIKKDVKKLSSENKKIYKELNKKRIMLLNRLDFIRKNLIKIDEDINKLFI